MIYNLVTIFPGISMQWHPTKNNDLSPNEVKPFSNKKVWWKCKKNHEWQQRIDQRVRSVKICPSCHDNGVSDEYNLFVIYPKLAKEWHPKKNGKLKPSTVMPRSEKNVWWRCKKGHEFQKKISHRIRRNKIVSCQYCAGSKASIDNNLDITHPHLAKQWHHIKNKAIKPKNITIHSTKSVWWLCEQGHEWEQSIDSRVASNKICPHCYGHSTSEKYNLNILFPDIASQWHPTKNGKLISMSFSPFSHKKVWWKCLNNHEWQVSICSRTRNNTGCPYCSGRKVSKDNNLEAVNPALAKEWHPIKNGDLKPEDVTAGTDRYIYWKCSNNHVWKARVSSRSNGSGCQKCRYIGKERI